MRLELRVLVISCWAYHIDKEKSDGRNIYEGNFWNLSTKSDQLEWRGSKIVELRGVLSYGEIARELQVSKALITPDVQYLREQAKGTIKEYVTEHLTEQYQVCLTALDTILKHAFEIMETLPDNREKLQAMELFKDAHVIKLELLSNATTIDRVLNCIRNKQQEQEQKKHT